MISNKELKIMVPKQVFQVEQIRSIELTGFRSNPLLPLESKGIVQKQSIIKGQERKPPDT